MKKIAFVTFGCKINIFDTEVLKNSLHNFEISKNTEDADIVIFNTCTVTEKADKKFFEQVKKVKRANSKAKIVALGCYTQLEPEKASSLGIDLVLGSSNKFELNKFLTGEFYGKNIIISPDNDNNFYDYHLDNFTSHTRAFLKIQDGCDNFCTYCTIPKARGKSRSKSAESVLQDIHSLKNNGYKEIVLSGIDLGSYKNEHNGKETYLSDLLKLLLKIEGIRFRISSIEPWCIDDKLLNLFLNEENICPHFHIPLQAGADNILKKMNRKYKVKEFKNLIEKLSRRKNVMLATDIIAGFPGETTENFLESVNFLENTAITYAHVFSYSDRPHAGSRKMFPKIPVEEINRRSKILRELSEKKKYLFYKSMISQKFNLIIEKTGAGHISGFTENYIPVKINTDKQYKKGDLIKTVITEINSNNVYGKVL